MTLIAKSKAFDVAAELHLKQEAPTGFGKHETDGSSWAEVCFSANQSDYDTSPAPLMIWLYDNPLAFANASSLLINSALWICFFSPSNDHRRQQSCKNLQLFTRQMNCRKRFVQFLECRLKKTRLQPAADVWEVESALGAKAVASLRVTCVFLHACDGLLNIALRLWCIKNVHVLLRVRACVHGEAARFISGSCNRHCLNPRLNFQEAAHGTMVMISTESRWGWKQAANTSGVRETTTFPLGKSECLYCVFMFLQRQTSQDGLWVREDHVLMISWRTSHQSVSMIQNIVEKDDQLCVFAETCSLEH